MDTQDNLSQWKCMIPPPSVVSYNDRALTKSVEDTHKPDGRKFDVKPVLSVIEQIFLQAERTMLTTCPAPESKFQYDSTNLGAHEGLSCIIHKISCEISCKCSGEIKPDVTTMELLRGPVLSPHPWEGKMVLALAAFAMRYGEFCLTVQLHQDNSLAKSVALLKQLPQLLQPVGALNPNIETLKNLSKEMLELTRCIIEFSYPPLDKLSLEHRARATAQSCIASAVSWIIQSAVVGLISMSPGYLVAKSEDLGHAEWGQKLEGIHEDLKRQLNSCREAIGKEIEKEKEKAKERYRDFKQLFRATYVDNLKILREIFPSKDDNSFIRCTPDRKEQVKLLRGKIVLLLISDLQITEEDRQSVFSTLRKTHKRYSQDRTCEVVWIPIIDQVADSNEQTILREAAKMQWLTAYPPPDLNSAFVKYVRKEWRFSKKTIVVALDAQGQVTNPNAHHMINIWGADAYPFSTQREESLWKAESWKFQFLIKGIQNSSISGKKQICLYGGDDIGWIKSFTSQMKKVMTLRRESIEMVYVGKAHPTASIREIIKKVQEERISATWSFEEISLFWTRLNSMQQSRMQIQMGMETDNILQEVTRLFTYGSSAHGCALVANGEHEMFVNEGQAFFQVLDKYESWEDKMVEKGFMSAFRAAHSRYWAGTAEHCFRLLLPSSSPIQCIACPGCRKNMEKYILFQCCGGARLVPDPDATHVAAAGNTAHAAVGAAAAALKHAITGRGY